jgi:hypothetical protein
MKECPRIEIRIEVPVYRIKNGRTITRQREYLKRNPDQPSDLFTHKPEDYDAQVAQHNILLELAKDQGLLEAFEKEEKQKEPLIVTRNGVVVNGNRRLCVWRKLYYENKEKYKHFEFVEVVVLPPECDEDEIKELEKRLQIQNPHRAEYKWHAIAAMLQEESKDVTDYNVLAKTYNLTSKTTVKDPKRLVETWRSALALADSYLTSIGHPEEWSLVDNDRDAFLQLAIKRFQIKDQSKQALLDAISYNLIKTKSYGGRLFLAIPDIADHLDEVRIEYEREGILKQRSGIQCTPGAFSGDDDSEDDLLGGEACELDDYAQMAAAIRSFTESDDSNVPLGDLTQQILDNIKSRKKEEGKSTYLVNTLKEAVKKLRDVVTCNLPETTVTEGASENLQAIREYVDAIEKWLKEHESK